MEQLPTWLTAAVFAAGMTAYADDIDPLAKVSPIPSDPAALDELNQPLH
jgi:hypothetical protein